MKSNFKTSVKIDLPEEALRMAAYVFHPDKDLGYFTSNHNNWFTFILHDHTLYTCLLNLSVPICMKGVFVQGIKN
jgi:hypothetical protein